MSIETKPTVRIIVEHPDTGAGYEMVFHGVTWETAAACTGAIGAIIKPSRPPIEHHHPPRPPDPPAGAPDTSAHHTREDQFTHMSQPWRNDGTSGVLCGLSPFQWARCTIIRDHVSCPDCLRIMFPTATTSPDAEIALQANVLGYRFIQGPTFDAPDDYHPGDYVIPAGSTSWAPRPDDDPFVVCHRSRSLWHDKIMEAVRYEDAWGLLTTKPDGHVVLHEIKMPSSWEATRDGGRVTLLLARETGWRIPT